MRYYILIYLFATTLLNANILDDFRALLADHNYQRNRYEKALNYYSQISDPSQAEIYNMANTLYKSGRYKEAIAQYIQVQKPSLQYKKFHNIGNCFVALGEYKKAIIFYKNALKFGFSKATLKNLKLATKRYIKQKEEADKYAKKQAKEEIKFRKGHKKTNRFNDNNGTSKIKEAPDPKKIQKKHNNTPQATKKGSTLIGESKNHIIKAKIISDNSKDIDKYLEEKWEIILNKQRLKTLLIPLNVSGEDYDKNSY